MLGDKMSQHVPKTLTSQIYVRNSSKKIGPKNGLQKRQKPSLQEITLPHNGSFDRKNVTGFHIKWPQFLIICL